MITELKENSCKCEMTPVEQNQNFLAASGQVILTWVYKQTRACIWVTRVKGNLRSKVYVRVDDDASLRVFTMLFCLFVQDFSLAEFLQDQQVSMTSDPQGRKRQEAIWELFTSECVYFLDQLMVLKEVIVHDRPTIRVYTHRTTNKQNQLLLHAHIKLSLGFPLGAAVGLKFNAGF